jgi:hypothetical protein
VLYRILKRGITWGDDLYMAVLVTLYVCRYMI